MPPFVAKVLASCRMIGRRPGFSMVMILTIALGVGATTAMFSVIDGILLRPLALGAADQVHEIAWQRADSRFNLDQTQFDHLRAHAGSFAEVAAATPTSLTLNVAGQSLRLPALHVSADYFAVLGSKPLLGRAFSAADDSAGAPPTAIISESFWRTQFNGNPAVLGETIRSGASTFTIIGVVPGNTALLDNTALWLPLAPVAESIGRGSNYKVIGRLRPEIAIAAANAELHTIAQGLREQSPQWRESTATLGAIPLLESLTRATQQPLYLLFAAVGLLLMIAGANAANLMIARVSARERELAIRAAMGGSARTLALDVVIESLLLALLGSVLGWLIAMGGIDWLLSLRTQALLRQDQIQVGATAFGFAMLMALVCGLGAGLPSLWLVTRDRLAAQMRSGSTNSGAGSHAVTVRRMLVAGQIALSLVLLIGASLLIQTYRNLATIDLGFPLERTLAAELWTQGTDQQTSADVALLYEQISEQTRALPGVRAAGAVAAGLPAQWGGNFGIQLPDNPDTTYSVDIRAVTGGYFAALKVPLRQGRLIDARDRADSAPVVVINETLARSAFAGRDPLGARITIGERTHEIVGVVGDLLSVPGEAAAASVFLPMAQFDRAWLDLFESWFPTHLVVATDASAQSLLPAVERLLRNLDQQLPIGRVRSMESVYAAAIDEQRFRMLLLTAFAGFALALSIVGVYGVLSFLVQQQAREIGIQAALGASRKTLLMRAMRSGMAPVAAGSVIGLIAAAFATQWLASQLYGVDPMHLPTVVGAMLALGLASLLACLFPALRAMASDPVIALRAQ